MTQPREHRRATQAGFGRVAERYVDSVTHRTGADLELVRKLAGVRAGQLALDVATGGGHTARVLAGDGAGVIATDLTPDMLRAARRHFTEHGLPVRVCAADAEALPFPSGGFDLVTCRVAPHHFHDAAAFVHEVARVLRPGGTFVLEDHRAKDNPAFAAWQDAAERQRDPTHVQAYTEAQWCAWCADAGLEVDHTETYHKEHDFLDWCGRQDMDAEAVEALHAAFVGAPPGVAEAFRFTVAGSRIVRWVDDKLLLRARRSAGPP